MACLKRDGRFKARLVIQAYDYYDDIDVYSPVGNFESWDAKNAFLQSHMDLGDDYVCVVRSPDKTEMWVLLKALYGHPLASKLWHGELRRVLEANNWIQSYFDRCCFIRRVNGSLSGIIVIHVDDIYGSGQMIV